MKTTNELAESMKQQISRSGNEWEWLFESTAGVFIAGGRCASKAEAQEDARAYAKGVRLIDLPSIKKLRCTSPRPQMGDY